MIAAPFNMITVSQYSYLWSWNCLSSWIEFEHLRQNERNSICNVGQHNACFSYLHQSFWMEQEQKTDTVGHLFFTMTKVVHVIDALALHQLTFQAQTSWLYYMESGQKREDWLSILLFG